MRRNTIISLSFIVLTSAMLFSACSKNSTPSSASSGETNTTDGSESSANGSGGSSMDGSSSDISGLPTVHFGYNEYTINGDDREKLKGASETLKKAKAKITVEGHCDERGSSEYNLALGEKRAQSVKTYLQKLGVSSEKIATISYGKERPLATGQNEEAWAKNRRGELVVNR